MPHILVIDDDEQMRRTVNRILVSNGFEVGSASNASEGLEQVRTRVPDLIISDVRMEGQDGFDMLVALRAEQGTAAIPVIMITGLADREGMRRAMELGADDFLAKPFTPEELQQAVESRIRKRTAIESRAEERMAELRRSLSRTLSHELRTPLNAILGYADFLIESEEGLSANDTIEIGTAVRAAGSRLAKLVDNYLAYAETELIIADAERVVSLRRARTEKLPMMVREHAARIAAAHRRQADLALQVENVAVAVLDEHARKLVEELVENAFNFSEPGSAVTVTLASHESGCRLTVQDRGRGMTAEEVAAVGAWVQFGRRFYEQQGSGLGLSICRRLAEIYAGALDVLSEKSVGTSIVVTLPCG